MNIDTLSDAAAELLIAIDDNGPEAWTRNSPAHRELQDEFLIEWLPSNSERGGGRWRTTVKGADAAVELNDWYEDGDQ